MKQDVKKKIALNHVFFLKFSHIFRSNLYIAKTDSYVGSNLENAAIDIPIFLN